MFLDEKSLTVTAGKGGDGASLFRREKYVPYGGPDGGDGGNGGNVIFYAASNLHALSHLSYTDHLDAQNGADGGHQRSSGKYGETLRIPLPLGTVIYVEEDGKRKELTEFTKEGEEITIVKGGNGGWGNWHFKSSIQQAPERANKGLPGEVKQVILVLKLIADIGLVGLPNAGKSTLLSVVSAAQPKIADYQFTTLEPQLGVAEWEMRGEKYSLVIADLPGLIEGASQGKGLGATFLKHVERTRSIIHCVDSSAELEDMIKNYHVIRKELESWSVTLSEKKERIALTKTDLIPLEDLEIKTKALEKETGATVYPISSLNRTGLQNLLTACL